MEKNRRPGPLSGLFVPVFFFLLLSTLYSLLSTSAAAQDDPPDSAPPPLKAISKDERRTLDSETIPKMRTATDLRLMDARIADAEKQNAAKDFDAMYKDLGAFQYLIDDGLIFLKGLDPHDKKMLDYYKRFEIGLRGFTPRIELIRRELPTEYEPYLGHLLKYVREAREKALDPMFSDTVIPVVNKKPL